MRLSNRIRGWVRLGVGVLLAVGAAGCNSGTINQVLTPSPATVTNSFSGSLTQGATNIYTFTVGAYGPVTVTLTSVGPLSTMGLGVGIGLWDGANCGAALQYNTAAKMGTAAMAPNMTAGNYCLRVYESGNIPTDWTVTYSVDVLHP